MLQLERKKVDEKNVICLVSIFPSLVLVLKFEQFKKSFFLQFCDDLSKKPNSIKAIEIYASGGSHYTLSENDIVYRCLSHRS